MGLVNSMIARTIRAPPVIRMWVCVCVLSSLLLLYLDFRLAVLLGDGLFLVLWDGGFVLMADRRAYQWT